VLPLSAVRRFLGKFSFLTAILVVVGFVVFTYVISKPLRGAEKHGLVHGTIRPAAALRPDAPFVRYVALHKGRPSRSGVPEFAVDDVQTTDDGSFELTAEEGDGTQFYLLARIETARIERYCEMISLPPMAFRDDGTWVEAATDAPLQPLRIAVDKSTRCD
jgi:hypothetical protein